MAETYIRFCQFCGNQFPVIEFRGNRKFCSEDCTRKYHNKNRKNRNRKPRPPGSRKGEVWVNAPTLKCEGCGNEFKPKKQDRLRFCSRDCAFETQRKNKKIKTRWIATEIHCLKCNQLFNPTNHNQRYCSSDCKPGHIKKGYPKTKPKKTIECIDCGKLAVGGPRIKRCGKCSKRHGRLQYKLRHGRVSKHRERAIRFNVAYEPINPDYVFQRDNWTCQICGIKTPKRFRGTNKPNAPELDHRVPMAQGGSHTLSNVQCSCRKCNAFKGSTKVIGQLKLFPDLRGADSVF